LLQDRSTSPHLSFHPSSAIAPQFSAPIVINDGAKRREVKEIKPQRDTRFNVKNSLNTRGKNHRRQPTSNFTMIGVRLQTLTAAAYKKYNKSISNEKILMGLYDSLRSGLSLSLSLRYDSSEVDLYLVHNECRSSINTLRAVNTLLLVSLFSNAFLLVPPPPSKSFSLSIPHTTPYGSSCLSNLPSIPYFLRSEKTDV
jgi:hypothetical protein